MLLHWTCTRCCSAMALQRLAGFPQQLMLTGCRPPFCFQHLAAAGALLDIYSNANHWQPPSNCAHRMPPAVLL